MRSGPPQPFSMDAGMSACWRGSGETIWPLEWHLWVERGSPIRRTRRPELVVKLGVPVSRRSPAAVPATSGPSRTAPSWYHDSWHVAHRWRQRIEISKALLLPMARPRTAPAASGAAFRVDSGPFSGGSAAANRVAWASQRVVYGVNPNHRAATTRSRKRQAQPASSAALAAPPDRNALAELRPRSARARAPVPAAALGPVVQGG